MRYVFGMLVVLMMAACSENGFDSDYDGGEDGGTDGGDSDTDSDGDTDTDSDSDSDSGTDSGADTDTDSDYYETIVEGCDPSAVAWPVQWSLKETNLLWYINEAREGGADCGSFGAFEPAAPLVMNPYLQCAARTHSLDMGIRGYFTEDSPGGSLGDTAEERVINTGYEGLFLGETILCNGDSPYSAFSVLITFEEFCAKVMNPAATQVGIGFASVDDSPYQSYWTIDYGSL